MKKTRICAATFAALLLCVVAHANAAAVARLLIKSGADVNARALARPVSCGSSL